MLYFDHNATTPSCPEAREAWLRAADEFPGNPSSLHRMGARADRAIQEARESLAERLGCDALDLVWTSGATESNNQVLHHFTRTLQPDEEVWISAIEHPCVFETAQLLFPKRHKLIPVSPEGTVNLEWIRETLKTSRPSLVAVMAANNETGILQPWREVLNLCREHEVPFFCDAAQWIGKLPAKGLGECDFVSGCAHKFGGPKGVGFLKCPARGKVLPLLSGGPQEEGRRAGTENVPGILSMLAALAHRESLLANREDQPRNHWMEAFAERLILKLPGIRIVGREQPRLWNTLMAIMPAADCQQRWVVKLDKLGCAVSTGSACASGKEASSHVLSAMGYADEEASSALRFSSGWETSQSDWDQLLEALVQVHKGMQTAAAK